MKEKPQALRVDLLGGFRVSVGPRTIGEDAWRLKKAKSLLKLLALATAPHSSVPTFPSVRCAVHTAQPFADALLVGYLPSSLHLPRAVHYASF
jgi:hypothetical protein